ncbi:MAG: hypothetical protein EOO42_16770 [Flavobacteriales bacterium]|nr:MAG: hypothetical protein EOO42_16770 [Flavobacteriales bacterium]
MKTTFLAFIFWLGMLSNHGSSTPYVGKWHNVSSTAAIQEVLFFPGHSVKFSNRTYSLLQRYSISAVNEGSNKFVGFFEVVNVGKVVKKSSVELNFLENDLMELTIDGKKLILKKH